MNRIALLLMLIIVLTLSGCQPMQESVQALGDGAAQEVDIEALTNEQAAVLRPYEQFSKASKALFEKLVDADSMDINFSIVYMETLESDPMDFIITSSFKYIQRSEIDLDFSFNFIFNDMMNRHKIDITYVDGVFYIDFFGYKVKGVISEELILIIFEDMFDDWLGDDTDFYNDDFLEFLFSPVTESIISERVLEISDETMLQFRINYAAIEDVIRQDGRFIDWLLDDGDEISDMFVNATLDADGNLRTLEFLLDFSTLIDEIDEHIVVTAHGNLNFVQIGGELTVDPPSDRDSFLEIDLDMMLDFLEYIDLDFFEALE